MTTRSGPQPEGPLGLAADDQTIIASEAELGAEGAAEVAITEVIAAAVERARKGALTVDPPTRPAQPARNAGERPHGQDELISLVFEARFRWHALPVERRGHSATADETLRELEGVPHPALTGREVDLEGLSSVGVYFIRSHRRTI